MLLEAYDQKNAWINNLAPLSIVRHKLHIIHVRLSRLNKHEMLSLLDVESEERPSKFFSTSHLRLISLAFSRSKETSPPHRRPPLLFRLGSAI